VSRRSDRIEILGLGLLVLRRPDSEDFSALATYRGEGIEMRLPELLYLLRTEVENLLGQIEGQYADFGRKVHWGTVDGLLHLEWAMDERGRLAGRLVLDAPGRWRFEGVLAGDQSYLPPMALGLRLLLRA
jgi:hypothetical protein